MKHLTSVYWNNKYINKETGWDLGEISSPLKAYINQIHNKDLRILIPGAGNAYEAIYLLENSFTNVTVIDYAKQALSNLKLKLNDINIKNYHLVEDNFFNHQGEYDLILEQTFFCAINPELRKDYINHAYQLLSKDGKIAGLLFNRIFPSAGPPFGGNKEEYRSLFETKFNIKIMEKANNSVKPRMGSELFFVLVKEFR
jgi:SAM-dependent methyltransferase